MTGRIGFVNTDNQDQEEPIMGRIEDQSDGGWTFWKSLTVDFLLAFGALSLLKEILVFLMGLKNRV